MSNSKGTTVLEDEKKQQDKQSKEQPVESNRDPSSALSEEEYQDIEDLVLLMEEHDLVEVEFEEEERRIRLKRRGANEHKPAPGPGNSPQAAVPQQPPQPASRQQPVQGGGDESTAQEGQDETPVSEGGESIQSPLVGTFYRAPAPDADPFVEEGDEVDEDTVVCIIEAMKVMNEIKAETSGTVEQILVDDGEAVDFDQPLIEITPSD